MTLYEKGDLVLVPFPFSDQTDTKKRPAVIISSDAYNSASSDVIIMAVTSRVEKSFIVGEFTVAEWKSAGLLKPSAVKPVISTIEKSLVLKKLGKLSRRDMASLENSLRQLLDLT